MANIFDKALNPPVQNRQYETKQENILSNLIEENEAGKACSIYLSSEAIELLNTYNSIHRINNKSKIIDALIKKYLK